MSFTKVTAAGIGTTGTITYTNVSVAGVITATSATFTGNVSVGGTLTYEDVTNVDSVGLITARSGVSITGGGLVVTGVTTVSAGSTSAPSISPTGDTNTGIFFPSADTIAFGEGGTEVARFDSNGRLGIGTVSPGVALHVNGEIRSTAAINAGDGASNSASIRFWNANTGLYHPGSDVLGFVVSASEKARIDSSGRLLVGTSTARSWAGVTGQFQLEGTSFSASSPFFINNQNSVHPAFMMLGKTRGTSVGSNTIVQNGDWFGSISFAGADGSALLTGASIDAFVDGTPGANDMPGRLVFSTTADGASSPSERLRIDSVGRLGINNAAPSNYISIDQVGAIDADANSLYIGNNFTATGVNFRKTGNYAQRLMFDTATGNIMISNTASTGTAGNAISWSERLRIDSSGRLLVGTSTNSNNLRLDQKFAVVSTGSGNLSGASFTSYGGTSPGTASILDFQRSRGSTDGSMTAVTSGDTLGYVIFRGSEGTGFINGAYIIGEVDATVSTNIVPGRLGFYTSNTSGAATERIRLDSAGNFFVFSSGNDTVVGGNAAGSGTAQSLFTGVHSRTSTTGGGTVAYRIYNNGTTFSVSDARQKKNVETARNGYLEDLQQLRVVKYNWIDQADTESKELGLIAQEVAEVFPGLVQSADPSDPESTLGIKSSVFSFMLIKALQEAGEKIEALEARLSALESA